VFCAVPMAVTVSEVEAILDAVRETGLIYMMGETSYYNPATVFARPKVPGGAVRPGFLQRGRLRPRHGPRLLRRLSVQRGRELEGDSQLPADALPHARHRRHPSRRSPRRRPR